MGAARLAPQLTVEIELVLSQLILSAREVGSGLVINRAQASLVFEIPVCNGQLLILISHQSRIQQEGGNMMLLPLASAQGR